MLKRLWYGLGYALLWEGAIHITVLRHPKIFVLIFLTYIPIILVYSGITKLSIRKDDSAVNLIIVYLICGCFGLFGLEWNLLHNSPTANPNANQIAMFCYWAMFGLVPYLMQATDEQSLVLQSKMKRFFAIFFVLSWSMGIFLPMPARFVVVLFSMIIGYIWMSGYLFSYIANKANNDTATKVVKFIAPLILVSALIEQYLHSID